MKAGRLCHSILPVTIRSTEIDMSFVSSQFLLFFPVVTVLYFVIPHRFRWALLLAASCYFYMAFVPVYLLILLFTVSIDYVAAILIERTSDQQRKKSFLTLSILANLGVLAFFKYFNFANANLASLAGFLHWNYPIGSLSIILPIGLSFHTFQAISYTIEVYRGNQKVERHFGIYALYVMFYPQLVAGPIERPQNMLRQFRDVHTPDYERITDGLKQIAWGLFKKVVIADRLAVLVNEVFSNSYNYNGVVLLAASVSFAFQIFCDFSGYCDIALGAAKVMGFKLMTNFDRPYSSASFSEFWRRWHISLSTWFRDYLYIPLGGSRVLPLRHATNLMIVFVVSGLWHGANWTFVVWGAIHGLLQVIEIQVKRLGQQLPEKIRAIITDTRVARTVRVILVFAMVDFAWIFFRANDLDQALNFVSGLVSRFGSGLNTNTLSTISSLLGGRSELIIAFAAIAVMEAVHYTQARTSVSQLIRRQSLVVRWTLYAILVVSICALGLLGQQQFIYFQF